MTPARLHLNPRTAKPLLTGVALGALGFAAYLATKPPAVEPGSGSPRPAAGAATADFPEAPVPKKHLLDAAPDATAKPPAAGARANRPDPVAALGAKTSETSPSLLKTYGVLAGLVLLLVAGGAALRRRVRDGRRAPAGERRLAVRDALALGPKRTVYLLAVDGRSLVVGVSGDQMSLLSEFTAELPDEAPAAAAAPEPTIASAAETPSVAAVVEPAVALAVEVKDPPPAAAPPPPVASPAAAAAPPATPRPAAAITSSADVVPPPRRSPFQRLDAAEAAAATAATTRRAGVERVPAKFRKLLEAAGAAQGGR